MLMNIMHAICLRLYVYVIDLCCVYYKTKIEKSIFLGPVLCSTKSRVYERILCFSAKHLVRLASCIPAYQKFVEINYKKARTITFVAYKLKISRPKSWPKIYLQNLVFRKATSKPCTVAHSIAVQNPRFGILETLLFG